MRDGHGTRPALCQGGLGRVVGRIKINIWHFADQTIWPIPRTKASLFAGHEFQRSVHSEMQDDISVKRVAQPKVKGNEGVCRREPFFEQESHRVALVAEGGLYADKNLAELSAKNKHAATVRLDFAGCRAPHRLDGFQRRRVANNLVRADMCRDVSLLTVLLCVAFQYCSAQGLNGFRNLNIVAICLHRMERVEQRFKDVEVCSGSNRTRIGRKAEEHDADVFVRILFPTERGLTQCLLGKAVDALKARCHCSALLIARALIVAPAAPVRPVPPTKHSWASRAIKLG